MKLRSSTTNYFKAMFNTAIQLKTHEHFDALSRYRKSIPRSPGMSSRRREAASVAAD